jgi:hypothetical protein
MKKDEVKIGGTYAAKVTGKVVPVRIDAANPHSGWDGTNMKTKKPVRIKSAQQLRGPWPKQFREQMRAVHKADQENARLAEERGKSADGMTASERAMAKSAPKAKKTAKATKQAKKAPKRDTGKRRGTSRKKAGVSKADAVNTAMQAVAKAKKKRHSLLDLAATVLAEAGAAMTCKEMVEKVLAGGQWTTKGKTPAATLYSAILREMQKKGQQARFRKVERGKFVAATK